MKDYDDSYLEKMDFPEFDSEFPKLQYDEIFTEIKKYNFFIDTYNADMYWIGEKIEDMKKCKKETEIRYKGILCLFPVDIKEKYKHEKGEVK